MITFKEFLLEAHSFGCIMGTLSESVNQYIDSIQTKIDSSILYTGEDDEYIKGGLQKHFRHVTIFYGLTEKHFNQPLNDELSSLINSNKNFEVTIRGVDYFDLADYTVVFLKVYSPELRGLHDKIVEFVPEYKSNFPDYTPHVAVAWIEPGKRIDFDSNETFTEKFKEIHIYSPSD